MPSNTCRYGLVEEIFDAIKDDLETRYVCEEMDLLAVDDHDEQMSELRHEIDELKAEIASLTASLEGAREEISQLEKEKE